MRWRLMILMGILGCDSADSSDTDGGIGCDTAQLVSQCPLGSNPVVGDRAITSCQTAASGIVTNATGEATAQCHGVSSCRVMCQFAVPCACGIESVSRDGVICADCMSAASCGNGRCEGGETPENCSIDCGQDCQSAETRCDGEALQTCNLQGRWEHLDCPAGEICSADSGQAQCAPRPDIIVQDGGVPGPDGGVINPDERIIDGDGDWPALADLSAPPGGRDFTIEHLAVQSRRSGTNSLTQYGQISAHLGGIGHWRIADSGEWLEGAGAIGRARIDRSGALLAIEDVVPVSADVFCAPYDACERGERCRADYARNLEDYGPAWVNCVAANEADAQCGALGSAEQTCFQARFVFPWPQLGERRLLPLVLERAGNRFLAGIEGDASQLLVADLAHNQLLTHAPVGNYSIHPFADGSRALSGNGEVATMIGTLDQDQTVIIWDLVDGQTRLMRPISGASTSRMGLSADGQVLAMVMHQTGEPALDNVVSFWNLSDQTHIMSIRARDRSDIVAGAGLKLSPDGRHLALDGAERIEIWETRAGEIAHLLEFEGDGPADALAWHPDGILLATAHQHSPKISLWDTRSGQRLATFESENNTAIRAFEFSDNGRFLLAARAAGGVDFLTIIELR